MSWTNDAIPFTWDVPETFNFGADVVDAIARDNDHLALIWCDASGREESYRFSDISRLTNRFANVLASRGIKKGDRVIVMLPRIPQWQIAMVGCLKLGAIPIPCIEMLTERDIAYRVEHGDAVATITTAPNVHKFANPGKQLTVSVSVGGRTAGWLDYDTVMEAAPDHFIPAPMAADDPAIMYYTSGSSGHPKGVMHAARGLYAWRVSARCWLGLNVRDVTWCTADTGWSKAGTSILFGPWSQGATVLFHDGPFDPKRRLELLSRHKVTVYCAAATELRRIAQENVADYDLSALRRTVSAGEAVNPVIAEQWESLTGAPLLEAYGQTETLMTIGNLPDMPRKIGSMGRPLPGTEVAVIGAMGQPLTIGESGVIAIRLPNPQLMLGYWKEPDRTRDSIISDGSADWFLTGDLGTIDADGYVFYSGRSDDVINSAGYRIGPMEVENALIEHPSILECAVVAAPDAERGEIVKAYVVLRSGWDASSDLVRLLQEHVKGLTAPYKYPRRVEFVNELPKTATGKISRKALRDREFRPD